MIGPPAKNLQWTNIEMGWKIITMIFHVSVVASSPGADLGEVQEVS
jgi:hypothetical protein